MKYKNKRIVLLASFLILFLLSFIALKWIEYEGEKIDISIRKKYHFKTDKILKSFYDEAVSAYKQKAFEKAISQVKNAIEHSKKNYGRNSADAAYFYGCLGSLYILQGDSMRGRYFSRKALKIKTKIGISGTPLGLRTELFFDTVQKGKSFGRSN